MLHIVTAANAELYADRLEEMYRLRKRVFVDELGWKLPHDGVRERDEYDDDRAIYLLDFDEENRIAAAQRVRPTADRSMLADHFPKSVVVTDRPIGDATTWEMSRGFVVGRHRGEARQKQRAAFRIAMLEAALSAGIDRIVGFTEVRLLSYFLNAGYPIRLLGLPIPGDEGDGIAFEIPVNASTIERMRETWSHEEGTLFSVAPDDLVHVPAHAAAERLRFSALPQLPAH